MTTRFAPSPTGLLHLGHAYAAKVAHERGSEFLLRFEDIDHTRVREEYYGQIEEDLRWLGIDWLGVPWRQLDRMTHYQEALEKLKSMGVVYPCFCTRREISEIANAPQGPEGPIYPGTCRKLSEADVLKKSKTAEPAWRLDTGKVTSELSFNDRIHGEIEVDSTLLGDVVLARRDIGTSYHLAVVVDDAAQEIDLVTRGEDLLSSTHVHRVLQNLLGFREPEYEHHRLICDATGERLAKRNEAASIKGMRESEMTPQEALESFSQF
ncbi:tRNA glutamyl-Q(34) synthetase GluQRS [Akkermansiaceae bacterium]|nr:tRNA glutamyl-Q(34) synthetase GluQRS [Akkermansiaceae bacterium]MDB4288398.1 tRNA glutamyl-Q(34) synthetase GluQRS [bacterium]MDA8960013.1 tRNA glutamyl-Q(34) synthetase GluQRS [Akkermansiaceae bacterium]MDB4268399.1 tRNA glutamyl-Q(34) synthetase GluQRS [Akkermansiaceae bacterium]MDB4282529.1 tRNA glutamyl-Q(34) synthetase GluQRS [Akkermansiaceae bacterium]